MFDVPLDGVSAWVGLSLTGVVLFGVVSSLPTAPPPDATDLAATVDRTASAEYAATAEHPVTATALDLDPHGVGLRNEAGTTHATFAFGRVTPVARGTRLWTVLNGAPPDAVFESRAAFAAARRQARVDARATEWRPVDGPVRVRHLTWGGDDVTLVGA